MARQILTRFDPDKKSAVPRQKIGWCTAAFRVLMTKRQYWKQPKYLSACAVEEIMIKEKFSFPFLGSISVGLSNLVY